MVCSVSSLVSWFWVRIAHALSATLKRVQKGAYSHHHQRFIINTPIWLIRRNLIGAGFTMANVHPLIAQISGQTQGTGAMAILDLVDLFKGT